MQQRVDDELVVEWKTKKIDPVNQIVTFSGGIKATYGPTTILADSLELDLVNKTGKALGNVHLLDPEGELRGSQLEFNWATRTGRAESAVVEIAGLKLVIRDIQIDQGTWTLRDVKVGGTGQGGEVMTFQAREVKITPGVSARAVRPTIAFGSFKIAPIPVFVFSLDKRAQGMELPTLSFRRRAGFGLNWEYAAPLIPQSVYGAKLSAFPNSRPSVDVFFALSGLRQTQITRELRPRSDLGEPFSESYFDNISVRNPLDEEEELHARRRTIGIQAGWNQSTRARPNDSDTVNRSWDVVGEVGDGNALFGGTLQAHWQRIRPESGQRTRQRISAQFATSTVPWALNETTSVRLRFDGFGTTGYGDSFGWLRAQLGLIHQVNNNLQLGAALAGAVQTGNPIFAYDPLYARNTASARADFKFGNYKLNLMTRFDLDRAGILSREASFSFVAGAFEPFISWREFPSDIRIGFTFRGTDVFDRLTKRIVKREKNEVQPKSNPNKS